MLYVPCPGGHMRFHILYDDVTRLYWLLSSLPTDSMARPERLPPARYGLPNNERHVLALHGLVTSLLEKAGDRLANTPDGGVIRIGSRDLAPERACGLRLHGLRVVRVDAEDDHRLRVRQGPAGV